MKVGKDGVHPDDAEDAGAQDDDDGGHDGLAQAAGGGDGAIHKGRDAVGQTHDAHTLHAGVDDGRLGGEEGQELAAEHEQAAAQQQAHTKGIAQRDEVALLHAVGLACAVVLAHEAGTGHVEGGHAVVDEVVGVGGGGVALDHEGVEGVDACLDEEVGDGEDGVLEPGGQAQRQNAPGHGRVEPGFPEMQGVAVLHLSQRVEDEPGGNALRNGTGQRHAHDIQLADDDEEEVEQDVQHTRDAQEVQRLFGVADGAEDGVAKVVERQCGHTEEVDPQVEDGTGQQVFLGVQQPQQGGGAQQTHEQQHHTGDEADHQRRVNGAADVIGVPGPIEAGHQHVDAVAQADEKTGEQGDEDARGTHRTQRRGTGEPAHDRDVRHVEQHLQQVGQCQRQADQKDLLGQRAFRQRFGV